MTKRKMRKLAREAREFIAVAKPLSPRGLVSYWVAVDRRMRMILGEDD